jgi:hypothetical protein
MIARWGTTVCMAVTPDRLVRSCFVRHELAIADGMPETPAHAAATAESTKETQQGAQDVGSLPNLTAAAQSDRQCVRAHSGSRLGRAKV